MVDYANESLYDPLFVLICRHFVVSKQVVQNADQHQNLGTRSFVEDYSARLLIFYHIASNQQSFLLDQNRKRFLYE